MYIVQMRTEYEAAELTRFYRDIPQHDELTCVEVGCYAGESSAIAAAHVKKLICVDPWSHYVPTGELGPEHYFDQRVAPFGSKVEKWKMTSEEAAKNLKPYEIDMVYIDGMHDRYNVCRDILMWIPMIREHGMICGHDYTDRPVHAGVVKSVEYLLGKPSIVYGEGSWRIPIDDVRERIARLTKEEN